MMVVDFEGMTYELDVEEIDVAQAMLIKVKTGYNLRQWEDALGEADVEALKALYWLMMEQNGKRTNFDTINFKIVKFVNAVREATKKAHAEAAEENPTEAKPTDG